MTATVVYLHDKRHISGGETSLLMLWEHLDRRRFRPVLFGEPDGAFAAAARDLGVQVQAAAYPRLRQLAAPRVWRQLAVLTQRLGDLGAAILHGNAPRTNLTAALVGRRLGAAVVWHGRTLPRPEDRDVERWLRWWPDRIVCNSAAVARRFGGPDDRVRVIHNGVALDRFRPGAGGDAVRRQLGLEDDGVAIGMVGNFSPIKRHELFLEAAALLSERLAAARFVVVGGEVFPENRGRESRLRARAAEAGLGDRLVFAGVRRDMEAVLDALDVLVAASELEACSRAVLEAMAAGTPVVAADGGGNPELVADGETGVLFPPGDGAALAAAIEPMAASCALRRRLGAAARRRAEAHFGIDLQVRAIESVYGELLGGT